MGHSIVKAIIAVTVLVFIPEGFTMRGMNFLEKYDLGELSYIRMESFECGRRQMILAIVLDAEDLPHTVRVGNYIGKHHGMIEQITPDYIKVTELYQSNSGEWLEHTVMLPRVEGKAPRARFRYEEDHALHLLGEIDTTSKKLRGRLIQCRRLYGKDTERLACFDEAVGSLF